MPRLVDDPGAELSGHLSRTSTPLTLRRIGIGVGDIAWLEIDARDVELDAGDPGMAGHRPAENRRVGGQGLVGHVGVRALEERRHVELPAGLLVPQDLGGDGALRADAGAGRRA
jgi:hypothetical protein